jgi:plastocyanin
MVVYLEPVGSHPPYPVSTQPEIISQKGARFIPDMVVITVGQAVDFRNDESRPIEHNVFSRSLAKQFDLGLYLPPQGRIVVFDKPGAVKLYCSIHRYMDGVIYVCPTPFFARVAADGGFTLSEVPQGEYRLKTWQRTPRFDEQDETVRVKPGEAMNVKLEMKRG